MASQNSIGNQVANDDFTVTSGDIVVSAAGKTLKLKVAGGGADVMGTATLSSGSVTVSTTAVAANSIILTCVNTEGGSPGRVSVPSGSIVAGTSFVISSTSGSDGATINWLILNQS